MKKILIALLLTFFPGVLAAPEAGDVVLPHASAEAAVTADDIRAAILQLRSREKIADSADSPLCGLEKVYPFEPSQQLAFKNALQNVPCRLVSGLLSIRIYDDPQKPRALAGANSLHLRSDFFSLPEAEAVLIHELGHIADLSGLKTNGYRIESGFYDGNIPVYLDDPSYLFYTISWKSNSGKLFGSSTADFVTEYAMTDPFEDFAESFLFYIRHGKAFRAYAQENARIKAKYNFMKTFVFDGTEFNSGKEPRNLHSREWDATKL